MTKKRIVPVDSRYVPLTQQASCCVPTCIQMVMYRHDIPLIPAEKIGYELGLSVHPERAYLFYNVRTSEEKPPAGYGTRIYDPEFEPNGAFQRLDIPLGFEISSISDIGSPEKLKEILVEIEKDDADALLCFHHGTLINNPEKDNGHVVVFDRMIDGQIRIIDPSSHQPKWREVNVEKMYKAMLKHGEKRSAGVWRLSRISEK